ncbi:hypothetical protein D9M69_462080 [compost metagenome]
MGQVCVVDRQLEGLLEERMRRHAHDAAAALAVIAGLVAERLAGAQCAHAGHTRRAARPQVRHTDQPAILRDRCSGIAALSEIPAQQRMMDDRRHMAEAACALPHPGTQQAFGGKEHHLGIVGDGAQLAERRGKIPNAPLTELLPDARPIHEFDRRAQCISSRTGQQATTDSIQLIHLHFPPLRSRTSSWVEQSFSA